MARQQTDEQAGRIRREILDYFETGDLQPLLRRNAFYAMDRRPLEHARAAWNAGDADTATAFLRSIHAPMWNFFVE